MVVRCSSKVFRFNTCTCLLSSLSATKSRENRLNASACIESPLRYLMVKWNRLRNRDSELVYDLSLALWPPFHVLVIRYHLKFYASRKCLQSSKHKLSLTFLCRISHNCVLLCSLTQSGTQWDARGRPVFCERIPPVAKPDASTSTLVGVPRRKP